MNQVEQPHDVIAHVAGVIHPDSPANRNCCFTTKPPGVIPAHEAVVNLDEDAPGSENSCLLLRSEHRNSPGTAERVEPVCSVTQKADNMKDATVMLAAIEGGDSKAAEELLVLVYDELRRLAASKIASEAPGQTLQPTALVHEAWLRLVGDRNPSFKNREHFFRASAEAMRRILIDRARRKHTERHGGSYHRVAFEGLDVAGPAAEDQLLAVNEALDKLALEHPVQAELVKLRYFAGMTNEEVAQVMGISLSTVKNYWTFARAWLLNEIESH